MPLNAQQAAVVASQHPRLLVIAGAGTGKTTTMAHRVVRLLGSGTPAELILCVTFTRRAAGELRDRIESLMAEAGLAGRLPEISTLHAWGARLIRRYAEAVGLTRAFSIYDELDREDILRLVAHELGVAKAATARVTTLMRDQRVCAAYVAKLRASNAIDFDMIEVLTLKLITTHPAARRRWCEHYRHVIVDEYQDTNLAQVTILEGIAPNNLCVVGDARQAIYGFRGAKVALIIQAALSADFEVHELTINYRSLPAIVDYGNGCVDGDWAPMRSGRADGGLPGHDAVQARPHDPEALVGYLEQLHAQGVAWSDMAVLARTWSGLHATRHALEQAGVPINDCDQDADPWDTAEGRQLARALLLVANPLDDATALLIAEWGAMGERRVADLRSVQALALRARESVFCTLTRAAPAWSEVSQRLLAAQPQARDWPALAPGVVAGVVLDALGVLAAYEARGLQGRLDTITTLRGQLAEHATLEDFRAWWADRSAQERLTDQDAVRLLTVHAAKGLEWRVVVIADADEGRFPGARSTSPEELGEELRVWYVAVTRARDVLVACASPERPSRFLSRPGAPSLAGCEAICYGAPTPA